MPINGDRRWGERQNKMWGGGNGPEIQAECQRKTFPPKCIGNGGRPERRMLYKVADMGLKTGGISEEDRE